MAAKSWVKHVGSKWVPKVATTKPQPPKPFSPKKLTYLPQHYAVGNGMNLDIYDSFDAKKPVQTLKLEIKNSLWSSDYIQEIMCLRNGRLLCTCQCQAVPQKCIQLWDIERNEMIAEYEIQFQVPFELTDGRIVLLSSSSFEVLKNDLTVQMKRTELPETFISFFPLRNGRILGKAIPQRRCRPGDRVHLTVADLFVFSFDDMGNLICLPICPHESISPIHAICELHDGRLAIGSVGFIYFINRELTGIEYTLDAGTKEITQIVQLWDGQIMYYSKGHFIQTIGGEQQTCKNEHELELLVEMPHSSQTLQKYSVYQFEIHGDGHYLKYACHPMDHFIPTNCGNMLLEPKGINCSTIGKVNLRTSKRDDWVGQCVLPFYCKTGDERALAMLKPQLISFLCVDVHAIVWEYMK